MHYREDIDGLRAIAVLSVVLFHIDANWIPGGFVGVDVFFVISGFLITSIIVREANKGSFSFTEFYRRRLKRIVPVLTTTILVTLLLGHLILLPEDMQKLTLSAIASQFFVGNVYFTYFLDTSYFAEDAGLQPLLHLWSLGVEEQFYMIWPIVLTMGLKFIKSPWTFLCLILVCIIASISYAEINYADNPMFQYYMLPARAGELLMGAACSFVVRGDWRPTALVSTCLSFIGLSMVVYSLFMLSAEDVFPGLNAIPVIFGVALLIVGGSRRNAVTLVLSAPPMVWIGLISYSLYLWHWPVLAFAKYIFVDLSLVLKISSLGIIILLSVISYRCVEVPFRSSTKSFKSVFVWHFALPSLLISALAGLLGYGLHLLDIDESYRLRLEAIAQQSKPAASASYVCQSSRLRKKDLDDPSCIINGSMEEEPNVLLWGDSNAAHYVGLLGEFADEYDFSFRNFAHSACPPILNKPERFTSSRRRERCKQSAQLARERLAEYDIVFLSASWDGLFSKGGDEFDGALVRTLEDLVDNHEKVIVIGRIPRLRSFDSQCGRKAIKLSFLDCEQNGKATAERTVRVNDKIKRIALEQGAAYVDFNEPLCDGNVCSGYFDRQPLYFDGGHLSVEGSKLLGQRVRAAESYRELFLSLQGR